jgi:hypothetical protein
MAVPPTIMTELLDTKKRLEDLIGEKSQELDRINEAISLLNGGPAIRYNWSERAVECIRAHCYFLQTTEILECVLYGSEDLQNERKKRQALVGLSVALNNLVDKGVLRKIVLKGIKGHFYGFPEWFQEDGTPNRSHIVNLLARYGTVNDVFTSDLSQLTAMQAAIISD